MKLNTKLLDERLSVIKMQAILLQNQSTIVLLMDYMVVNRLDWQIIFNYDYCPSLILNGYNPG